MPAQYILKKKKKNSNLLNFTQFWFDIISNLLKIRFWFDIISNLLKIRYTWYTSCYHNTSILKLYYHHSVLSYFMLKSYLFLFLFFFIHFKIFKYKQYLLDTMKLTQCIPTMLLFYSRLSKDFHNILEVHTHKFSNYITYQNHYLRKGHFN